MIQPPQITVEIDKNRIAAIERAVGGSQRVLGRIVYNALKKTAKKGRTKIDKEIRSIIQIKKRSVTNRIYDAEKATSSNWRWRLALSKKRIGIASFGSVRQTKKGVSYTITRGRRKMAPHAFITKGFRHAKSGEYIGSKSVFRRAMAGEKPFPKGTPTRKGDIVRRYPLIFLKGPSIAQVVKNHRQILYRVHVEGQRDLSKEIHVQLRREIIRRLPKAGVT